jgi:phospholipase C
MRRFCALSTLAAFFAAGCNGSVSPPVPPARESAIRHVVILLQENRSFNNIFAGFPGAETAMSGKCKPAAWCPASGRITLKSVKLESNGIFDGGKDIDHSHNGFEIECDPDAANVCRNDGFDLIHFGQAGSYPPAKRYPYRYVDRSESKPYWDFAKQYTLADHMFYTATASSFTAHQQIIAGTTQISPTESYTDQPSEMPWGCDAPGAASGGPPYQITFVPVINTKGVVKPYEAFPCETTYGTMADLLDAKHVSWKYYIHQMFGSAELSGVAWNGFDVVKKVSCTTRTQFGMGSSAYWKCTKRGADWSHITNPNTKIFDDVKNGTLPSVSWVIPLLCDSDHPASGSNRGPLWITKVVNAIGESKYWNSTAIIVLWDDWGGWYDPVPPPQINYTSLGFRVGMIVISPYAKRQYVSHTQYDFGSVLKFIEQNFGLGSLGTSDVDATSIGDVFDFTQRPIRFKPEPLPQRVNPCIPPSKNAVQEIIERDGGVPE